MVGGFQRPCRDAFFTEGCLYRHDPVVATTGYRPSSLRLVLLVFVEMKDGAA
jgi:hypothetical protein